MATEALNISKTFLPHRADQATMATTKAGIILSKGEFFLEYPNTGPGTKGTYRIKIGDGKTKYKDLPYALGDPTNSTVIIKDEQFKDLDFQSLMDAIKSGTDVSTVIMALKEMINNLNKRYVGHDEDKERHITNSERNTWNNVAVPEYITQGSLNSLTKDKHSYYTKAGNNCTDKPDGVDGFTLDVNKTEDGKIIQTLIDSATGVIYTRVYNNGTWSSWNEIYSSGNPQPSVDVAINDSLKQKIVSTYIKKVTDTPSDRTVQLSTAQNAAIDPSIKDTQKIHSHNMEFFTGDDAKQTSMSIKFDEANTQYQLHTNSTNDNKVNDGDVKLQLTSTDSTTNVIRIKGDTKGVKVSAINDEITISSEDKLSSHTRSNSDGSESVQFDFTDINGNISNTFTISAGYDTEVLLSGPNEVTILSKSDLIDLPRIPVLPNDKLPSSIDESKIPTHRFVIERDGSNNKKLNVKLVDSENKVRDYFSLIAGYDTILTFDQKEITISSDDKVYQQAVGYTDKAIADLIDSSPETRDTLGEINKALKENDDLTANLLEMMGTKANDKEMHDLLDTKLDKGATAVSASKVVNALSFTGGSTVKFDGSSAQSVFVPPASTSNPIVAGTATVGTSTNYARADHIHPVQTSVSGNAGTATTADKVAHALTFTGGETGTFNGSADKSVFIPPASTSNPIVAGTATVGTSTNYARADHVHPVQTSVSGNAGSASKVNNALSFTGGSTISFDGSSAQSVFIPPASSSAPIVAGTATVGTSTNYARADHIHPVQTSVSGSSGSCTGNAASATKVNKSLTFTGGTTGSWDGSADKSVFIPPASTSNPVVAGTATVGTSTNYARADHVHPVQTSVSGSSGSCTGNAATATTASKVANALTFTGGVTGTWDGSATKSVAIPTTLPASDVYAWAKAATKPSYTPTEVGVIGTAPTSGQVAVFDGTTGKIKSTGFTIATSVPSGAVFTDHTYSVMGAATASAAGTSGLVPAPGAGKNTSFLRGDGTWVVPTNTTYGVMGAATASAAGTSGLVPAPGAGKNTSFLRGDGTWQPISLDVIDGGDEG